MKPIENSSTGGILGRCNCFVCVCLMSFEQRYSACETIVAIRFSWKIDLPRICMDQGFVGGTEKLRDTWSHISICEEKKNFLIYSEILDPNTALGIYIGNRNMPGEKNAMNSALIQTQHMNWKLPKHIFWILNPWNCAYLLRHRLCVWAASPSTTTTSHDSQLKIKKK